MSNDRTVTSRLRLSDRVWREDASPLGNPRWSFTLDGTVYRTAPNSSVGYDIDNYFGARRPYALRLLLNSRGRVVGAHALNSDEYRSGSTWRHVCAHIGETYVNTTLHAGCWIIPFGDHEVMVDEEEGIRIGAYNESHDDPFHFVEFAEDADPEVICQELDRIVDTLDELLDEHMGGTRE